MKSIKKLFIIVILLVVVVSMVVATASAENVAKDEKKNTGSIIGSKEKTVSYKITWNANGGKIGTKKTTVTNVNKGSKIAKLVTTPKRSGYTFQGWFSKKSGGKKISKNTVPTKKVTYYAQWEKTHSLNAAEKKLVGTWTTGRYQDYDNVLTLENPKTYKFMSYKFKADGTFEQIISYKDLTSTSIGYSPAGYHNLMNKGKWFATSGGIYLYDKLYFEGGDKDRKMWVLKFKTKDESYGYELISNGKTLWINDNIHEDFFKTLYKK